MPVIDKDIFSILIAEHREVESALEKILKSEDTAFIDREFKKMRRSLLAHAKSEQDVLYPRLKEEEETRGITLEGVQEHHVLVLLLQELQELADRGEIWHAKLHVLQESVEHHHKEEEKKMIPTARKILEEGEGEALRAQYEQRRDELIATL